MIRIFIGYDTREAVAFHVLAHSIHRHASSPVSIAPLMLSQLGGVLTRERAPLQSTDFAFSRFLVPYLCDYEGWALFLDSDMLCLDDVARLWDLRDERCAVMCVKHQYEVSGDVKFLGQKQTRYEKKNWSSAMLFNCRLCTALTPEFVNTATGLQLHQFQWLPGSAGSTFDLVGELPKEWNYLAGYYPHREDVSLIHYTDGGPYFEGYEDCDYAGDWRRELKLCTSVTQQPCH